MNDKSIADFRIGDEITGFYALRRVDVKARRDNQGHFLAVDLADAAGAIAAKVWDDAEENAKRLRRGDIVKIKGAVQSFQGRKQLSIQRIRKAGDEDEIELSQLVASISADIKTLWREYVRLVESIVNPFLRSLLRKFTENEAFRNDFCEAVASVEKAQAFRGGLLQHTIQVTKLCEKTAAIYPNLNRDLLLTAALLHDIGKIDAFTRGPVFDLTEQGELIGHNHLTFGMILRRTNSISAFPADLSIKLQHTIITPGKKDDVFDDALPEAMALHFANSLDSGFQGMTQPSAPQSKRAASTTGTLNLNF